MPPQPGRSPSRGQLRMPEPVRLLIAGHGATSLVRRFDRFEDITVVDAVDLMPAAMSQASALGPHVIVVLVSKSPEWALRTIEFLASGTGAWSVVAMLERPEPALMRRAVRAGARDVLARSASDAELYEAVVYAGQAARADRIRLPGGAGREVTGTVVVVFSAKGGVGRTTLAANLALGLASLSSARTTLVDLDLAFGDIGLLFDLEPKPDGTKRDVVQALDDPILEDDDALRRHVVEGPQDLLLLPAPTAWDPPRRVEAARVTHLLQRLATLNQFVIVDAPAGMGEVATAALDAADVAGGHSRGTGALPQPCAADEPADSRTGPGLSHSQEPDRPESSWVENGCVDRRSASSPRAACDLDACQRSRGDARAGAWATGNARAAWLATGTRRVQNRPASGERTCATIAHRALAQVPRPQVNIARVNRSTERILATHTGKLFMPDAGNTGMGPPPTPPDRVEHEINALVKKQIEIGMDIISNGEPAGIGPGTIFRLVEGFETIDPHIPDDEPIVSLERVRWLSRDMLKYTDFYSN